MAKALQKNQNCDKAINFLVSLDFLIKGLTSHWNIRLSESPRHLPASSTFLTGLDVKFPILIGDQFHTIAYFMASRLGNLELTRILTIIEENFQKIFYNVDSYSGNLEQNQKAMYK